MRGLAGLVSAGAMLLLVAQAALPATAQDAAPAAGQAAGPDAAPMTTAISADAPPSALVWSRSIVCPVLYSHEVVSQALFRRLLLGLLGAGYHPTTLAAIDAAMTGAADRPPGCLLLSFDDGLYSQFANALPVLTDLGLSAVFFVLPGYADGVHRYMGATEYQALVAAGEDVEMHTCNHPNLVSLARRNLSAMFAELQDCKGVLEDLLGTSVNYLAYPYGASDATVIDAVQSFGYRAAFGTRPAALLTVRTQFNLPRIRFDAAEPAASVLRRIHADGG